MEFSARNQINGKVTQIKDGNIVSEVIIDIGNQKVCSIITTSSKERLNLKTGDNVSALIKASNVIISK